eukprot:gene9113-10086_t
MIHRPKIDENLTAVEDQNDAYMSGREFDDGNERGRLISNNSDDEASDSIEALTRSGRHKSGCHQQFTDFSNVFKAFIGSSLIGLPFAIRNSGIVLGLIGITVIALATDHCCALIVKCKQIVIKRMCEQMAADGYVAEHIKQREQHLGKTLSFGMIAITKMNNPFSHGSLQDNKPWTFALLLTIPAPILMLIALVRSLRKLGPVSVLANGSITGAFLATGIYILADFESPHETIVWFNWLQFPVFFGQITGAYEGIGTVIPIEGSMAENRHRYPCYLHISLALLSSILASFGILGYLRFGNETNQIVTENLEGSVIVIILRCLLFFGVLFTYPLQIYPIIEIVEGILFKSKKLKKDRKLKAVVNADTDDHSVTSSSSSSVATLLEHNEHELLGTTKIPFWRSNFLRCFLVLSTAMVAILFRSQFAYIAALTVILVVLAVLVVLTVLAVLAVLVILTVLVILAVLVILVVLAGPSKMVPSIALTPGLEHKVSE